MVDLIKSNELTEAQKTKMFFDYSAAMRQYYDMPIEDICVGFVDQFSKSEFYVVLGDKGYVLGYEQSPDNFHISGLYFYGFSKELKEAIEKLSEIYNKYKHVTCNCNAKSASIAEKFGFSVNFIKMAKINLGLNGYAVS